MSEQQQEWTWYRCSFQYGQGGTLQTSFQALMANPPLVSLLVLLLLVNVLFPNKPPYGGGRKQNNHQACQQSSNRGFASAELQKCWDGLAPHWPAKHYRAGAGAAILALRVLSTVLTLGVHTHTASPGTVNKGTKALQVQQVWPWVTRQPPAPRPGLAVSQTITRPFINRALPSIKLAFLLTD